MKEGWSLKSVKDVSLVIAGQSPEGRYYNADKVGLPFYQGKKEFGEKYIKSSGVWTSVITKTAIAGDILMSVRAPVGPVNVSTEEICIGRGLAAIRQKDNVIHDFLFYFFKYYEGNIKGNTGAVFDSINKAQIENIPFLIPPLPEQQRIVSIIDEAFEAIDKTIENTQKNLQNSKELFESYLNSVFENGDWRIVKLSAMATAISDGDHMPPPKSEFGLPFITISNINKKSHKIDFSNTFKVPQKYFDGLSHIKKPIIGDLLYTVTGSYGIPVLIEDNVQFCFQRHIGLIRPNEKLDSKLLYYWILSPQSMAQANETATGTAQKTVSLKSLRNFSFPEIPLPEQKKIVLQLNALRAETQQLDKTYQQKLRDLEELKKSVLNKAFAGEL